ncbi:MAG: SMP-30/gluconolactonase/LRE family protein [Aliidongia sp.]
MTFELALDAGLRLGESPVWLAAEQRLVFVDIHGQALHWFDPATDKHVIRQLDEEIGCVAPATEGRYIAGLRSGLWLLDQDGGKIRLLSANPEPNATNRFNDGRTDPAGRFLAGTIDEPKAGGTAHLYRYDRRGLVALAGGLLTSNGLAFSPDGRVMYHADTPRFVVRRYDYDPATGEARNPQIFIQLDPNGTDRGRPDGAAVDCDGCYWTALYEGGRVQRYSPEGKLVGEFPVPARKPTMIAFGGAALDMLYVTTAADPEDAVSGALWAMPAPRPGLSAPLFSCL